MRTSMQTFPFAYPLKNNPVILNTASLNESDLSKILLLQTARISHLLHKRFYSQF